jgi:hypothetical protein
MLYNFVICAVLTRPEKPDLLVKKSGPRPTALWSTATLQLTFCLLQHCRDIVPWRYVNYSLKSTLLHYSLLHYSTPLIQ